MAVGDEAAAVEHVLHLAPDERDVPRARAVRGVRVQAEEALLTAGDARLVELLHADVVEPRRPVHRRPRVRLRQVEQVRLPDAPTSLRRKLGERPRRRLSLRVAQDSEPRLGDRAQDVVAVVSDELVLAVAEEREVIVLEPVEERGGLGDVVAVERRRTPAEARDHLAHAPAHRAPVVDGGAHVAEDLLELEPELLEHSRLATVDLDVVQRLHAHLRRRQKLHEVPLSVAPNADDGVDVEVDRSSAPGERHFDGIHEERHVVRQDLDDAVLRSPPVLLEARRVHAHLRLAGQPALQEVPLCERGAVEVEAAEIICGRLRVEERHEPGDVVHLGQRHALPHVRDRGVDQCVLRCSRLDRQSAPSALPAGV